MNITVCRLYTYSHCRHPHIGVLKSYCRDFSVNGLREGVNVLTCPLNGNGWGLSNCLCSKSMKTTDAEGEFFLNGKNVSLNVLRRKSFYICGSEPDLLQRLTHKKVRDIISANDDEMFRFLSENGITDRELTNLGNWRYIVSFYLGFQKGARIFGFPWISASQAEIQEERLRIISDFAKKNDLLVILPCETGSERFLNGSEFRLYKDI